MNYQFITEILIAIPWRKHLVRIILLVVTQNLSAQDSIFIKKKWTDSFGKNALIVKVNALCNPLKPPFDGHPSVIEASLKNKKANLKVIFDDADYQMEMIYFREKNIWFFTSDKNTATFIPFLYCGNLDNDIKISFIIFYKNKKFLYHVKYRCDDENNCLVNENLNLALKDIPTPIKNHFIKRIKNKNFKRKLLT